MLPPVSDTVPPDRKRIEYAVSIWVRDNFRPNSLAMICKIRVNNGLASVFIGAFLVRGILTICWSNIDSLSITSDCFPNHSFARSYKYWSSDRISEAKATRCCSIPEFIFLRLGITSNRNLFLISPVSSLVESSNALIP